MQLSRRVFKDSSLDGKINEDKVYLFCKRIVDIVGATIGLIFILPILLIIALVIKVAESSEPVIFTQRRHGQYPKIFKMYKFRSMYTNAESRLDELQYLNEQTGPVFKITNDPRITKVGRFIRKTSLDELPQLINVLKGDMSLVGPRPALPKEVRTYTDYQLQRLQVKPGLTCIWQINGRNQVTFDRWVEMDIEYIKKRNFWLDLKLIILTIPILFGDKDAS